METEGSVTRWIADLKLGDDVHVAQQELWQRYFRRVVGLARKRLGDAPRASEDEEDVAISALNSFFGRAGEGKFPELRDRDNLWPLLAKITARKSINQRNRLMAQKRHPPRGRVRGDSVLGGDSDVRGAEDALADEVTPEDVILMNEQCQRLLGILPDDQLRMIACKKLENHTNAEIGEFLGLAERTVERKLSIIRGHWQRASE